MIGTIVNAGAVVVGAIIGVFLKKGLPERYKDTIIQGISLVIIAIGIQMAIQTQNALIVILSIVLGGLTGEVLRIEDRLSSCGLWMEAKIGKGQGEFSRAFVTASLVYCVGAMAIVGAIQDGIAGKPETLYVKALLDGVASIVFASTMGIGVAFSAIPLFLYQGSISLLAQYVQVYLTPSVITEMTATGGVLIFGIGLKVLSIKEIKVGNLLPAIFYALLLAYFFQK